jgi:hypothetical protein
MEQTKKSFLVKDGDIVKAVYPLDDSRDCVTCTHYRKEIDGCLHDECPGYKRAGRVVITLSGLEE